MAKRAPTVRGQPGRVATGQPSHHFDADAWFEYRLQQYPCFRRRIAEARESLRHGRATRLEDLPQEEPTEGRDVGHAP